ILFLILSAVIFLGWSHFFAPKPAVPDRNNQIGSTTALPSPTTTATPKSREQALPAKILTPPTQAELRQIKVKTSRWNATLSNKGGVVTQWTMTNFTDGKAIDPPKGVNLISNELSQKVGAPFRFYIPSDSSLENELNSAIYKVETENPSDQELIINDGKSEKIKFSYANNGVEATKTITFKGQGYEGNSGFEFDFIGAIKRNGNPVQAYILIGPNFGDQNVKEVSTYKHAPQLTYSTDDGSVESKTASSLKGAVAHPIPSRVTWAAVDDNYFAMTIVPVDPVPAVCLLNDNYVSIAVLLNDCVVNHIYACPKDIGLLRHVS